MDPTPGPHAEIPKRRTGHRPLRWVIALLVAAAAVTVTTAVPANAATTYWEGARGYTKINPTYCVQPLFSNGYNLIVEQPTVYAPNQRAGWGNDGAWVRWKAYHFHADGRLLNDSNWSSWEYAYDNQKAAFTQGAGFFNAPHLTYVVIRVEWWNQTYRIGAQEDRVGEYYFTSQTSNGFSRIVGPTGSGCWW